MLAAAIAYPENPAFLGGANYSPLAKGQRWVYSLFKKKENKQKDDVQAFIIKTEKIDNVECLAYEIPSKGMAYFITKDPSGEFVRFARVSLPVLGFINLDITLDPPICALKLPLTAGDAWIYTGIARVKLLAFITVEKKLSIEFKLSGPESVETHGKIFTAYHLHAQVNRRWDEEKPINGDAWLAENTGVIRAETINSLMELKEYDSGEHETTL